MITSNQSLPPITSPRTATMQPNESSSTSPRKLMGDGSHIAMFDDADAFKEEIKLNGPVMEEWINEVLKIEDDS
jgi:hypothetical protein